ncbi:MAG TPA: hypothetical protein VD866_24780 [Urbifossiella sp.]|nr:hypothetical protein [Urbifossiella sp.]
MFRPFVAVSLVAVLTTVAPAQPPAPKLDTHGEPLPPGAVARFGNSQRLRGVGAAVLPDFKTALYVTPAGLVRSPLPPPHARVENGLRVNDVPPRPVVSADGKRAAAATMKRVTVYDVATGKALKEYDTPDQVPFQTRPGHSLSLSADGRLLAFTYPLADQTSRVRVVDLLREADALDVHLPWTGFVRLSGDGAALATWPAVDNWDRPGADRTPPVRVWDTRTGKERFRAPAGLAGLTGQRPAHLAFSPGGDVLAVSSGAGLIELRAVADGNLQRTLLGGPGQALLAFSPDGATLATASPEGVVQRWAVADGRLVATTPPPLPPPPGVGTLPEPRIVGQAITTQGIGFRGATDVVAWATKGPGGFFAWEVGTGRVLADETGAGRVHELRFEGPDGNVVAVVAAGEVSRWQLPAGVPLPPPAGSPWRYPPVAGVGSPEWVRLLPSPDRLLRVTYAGGVVLDRPSGLAVAAVPGGRAAGAHASTIYPGHGGRVITMSTRPTALQPGRWAVWDLEASRLAGEGVLGAGSMSPVGAALSPSGRRLVTACTDRTLPGAVGTVFAGWDVATGKQLAAVVDARAAYGGSLSAVTESMAVLRTSGGGLFLVDYAAGRLGEQIEAGPKGGPGAVFAAPVVRDPAGTRLAATWNDPTNSAFGARVYGWPACNLLRTITGHASPVCALAFSPDGRYLATGSDDSTVLIWDVSAVRKE